MELYVLGMLENISLEVYLKGGIFPEIIGIYTSEATAKDRAYKIISKNANGSVFAKEDKYVISIPKIDHSDDNGLILEIRKMVVGQ